MLEENQTEFKVLDSENQLVYKVEELSEDILQLTFNATLIQEDQIDELLITIKQLLYEEPSCD